jgi:hypothetical protein
METVTYQGKMFAIVDKEIEANGKKFTIEVSRRAPGTRLIIDLGNELMLTKEWRPELNAYDYRLPGGKVFDSLIEYMDALATGADLAPAIEKAARLEAKQEVGVESGDFSHFHKSIAGLTVEWDLHYFAVTNPVIGAQELEEHEVIETIRVPKKEAETMCLSGAISEERSALVLLRYLSKN